MAWTFSSRDQRLDQQARPRRLSSGAELCAACRRRPGKYSDSLARKDFGKWKFIRNGNTARITRKSGRTYLSMLMKKGCYATSLGSGCGMYGRVPIRGVKTATIEYTCAPHDCCAPRVAYLLRCKHTTMFHKISRARNGAVPRPSAGAPYN